MSEAAPESDRLWILVVAHPQDGGGGLLVHSGLAARGLFPLIPEQEKGSTFRGELPRARAAVLVVGQFGADTTKFSALEKRAREPDFSLVVARVPEAVESELPPGLASAPVVDLAEPDGFERLVALLTGAPGPVPKLSPSTGEARRRVLVSENPVVSAPELARVIADIHPEYAGGLAGKLPTLELPGVETRHVDDWLRAVRELISESAAPELHGRAVLLALGLLDPALRAPLRETGVEEALVEELREKPGELLTERGLALYEGREEPAPADREETVPTHTDNPATIDELGREGIARVLARRIRDMRSRERAGGDREFPHGRSFLVHVHAPWGMGKTSLLNFLAAALQAPDEQGAAESDDPWSYGPWAVVEFNAWRHQRIAPPWWWLMTALYRQGRRALWRISTWRWAWFVGREWSWRLWIGWPRFVLLALVVLAAVAVWWFDWIDTLWGRDSESSTLTGLLLALAAVAAPLLTLWGTIRGAGRWLLTASPRGARAFVDQTRDPMELVKEHVGDLVDWLHYPVIVLVDDLDRCKAPYVVELLEGIQTLFRDQPVAYVVAADRDWLSDAYRVQYGDFVSTGDEPGRPLGYLFLEKTFQMSITLPPPSGRVRADYWGRLIRPGEQAIDRDVLRREREEADAAFAGSDSAQEVKRVLASELESTVERTQARREAAAIRLATSTLAREATHVLRPFAGLLEANPRAMKRLVNAYGIARGVQTLAGDESGDERRAQQETALWTILALRWPQLADHLERHPDHVAHIAPGTRSSAGVPADLRPLFGNPQVVKVVTGAGDGIDARLDEEAVRRASGQVQV